MPEVGQLVDALGSEEEWNEIMTRRYCPIGVPQHIVQRGNNRQTIFTSDTDAAVMASWLACAAERYSVQIHGWVFMKNHIHLLATPMEVGAMSSFMQYMGRLYVRYFNDLHVRSGTLFQGRFRSSLVEEQNYLINCLRYIELNPVRAGIVRSPGDYKWSSYSAHAHGKNIDMWTPHPSYLAIASSEHARQRAYRKLFGQPVAQPVIDEIRNSINRGRAYASKAYRQSLQKSAEQTAAVSTLSNDSE